ncbi:class Ib ribonucleoside-diphosphate reductase assembly flavoprotein NrdI [Paracoccus aerodenitrificans]|uniref:class Ib ribonucleoside-diphosphate reductase assembly flavoprotein NrdI n=1 Tax=Paracoccus aerodenitrificans TaxID=3017781 RepID=UPI0022F0F869|nr:class Ib ribonucleoside-diphosphate reductase assembly flavoprotein NrdI [Paracoccus aerodenitrificans]WBU63726.1 class Ib ribonucleoside-diphosphate reductase assembly flavoprotein NrdI [Paracoccus aerodenitrificans]
MAQLVYYSSRSGNTAKFVARLGMDALRIPISPDEPMPAPDQPYVLVTPTYADGNGKGAVHPQIIRFLNDPARRALIRGVIAAGNRNFGQFYAAAGDIIARKCNVPRLYRFELAGTDEDIARVTAGLQRFWRETCLTTA